MINENIIKQMPVLAPDHICTACKCFVSQLENQKIALYNSSLTECVSAIHSFYYCEKCGLPYSDKAINNVLKKENKGYHLCCFSIGGGLTIQEIKEKMLEDPLPIKPKPENNIKKVSLLSTNVESAFGYKVIHRKVSPASIIKKIVLLPAKIDECPYCYSPLRDFVNSVLIDEPDVYAKVEGKCCHNCNAFFYPGKYGSCIRQLLKLDASKGYTLITDVVEDDRFKEYVQYRKYVHEFEENSNYNVFLVAKNKESGEISPFVISNQVAHDGGIPNILCYRAPETRKILLEVAYKGKEEFVYRGNTYRIEYRQTKEGKSLNQLCNIVKYVYLEKDGGLNVYNDPSLEIVDILLYSPLTDGLEISRATYNKINKLYYMDVSLFKKFLKHYGKPDVKVNYISHPSEFFDMAEESWLHAYGYNVSSQDNFSNATRQSMIRDVIDLGWMDQEEVISLLKQNISMHKQPKYKSACDKWNTDICFTEHYQAHPERFIIEKK